MDLRILKYFLTIAREENITKASAVLHVTQPTLSRQLMQLEDELGVKLFTRSNHSIILTDEGMMFKRRAQEIVTLADKTVLELHGNEKISGEIAVGSGELLTFDFMAEVIAEFQKRFPLVNFDIYSGNADSIKEKIESGTVDIGLLLMPVDIGKYGFMELHGEEVWGAYINESSPLAEYESVTAQDLSGERIIMTKRPAIQSAIGEYFGDLFDNLKISNTYNLLGNAVVMVQQNSGIVIGLKSNCSFQGVRFVPLSPSFTSKTVMVWKKDQPLSSAVSEFINFAKKYKLCITDDKK